MVSFILLLNLKPDLQAASFYGTGMCLFQEDIGRWVFLSVPFVVSPGELAMVSSCKTCLFASLVDLMEKSPVEFQGYVFWGTIFQIDTLEVGVLDV